MERSCVSWRAQICRYRGSQQSLDFSKFGRQKVFVAAVLAATGRNRLNCGILNSNWCLKTSTHGPHAFAWNPGMRATPSC